MTNGKEKRVFWLGMHVVLTATELPRLRSLGFEVFNPPYNAKVYDQSANVNWDSGQFTTLPPEVFKTLSRYKFFYNEISPEIAEILNEYFGTVVVTISTYWLEPVLKVFKGRIIYRVFGQLGSLSAKLEGMGLFRAVQERDDFWFVPHSEETALSEHAWITERMRVVPYTLPNDIFQHRDTWATENHNSEIMVSCPNIANDFYRRYYKKLNAVFPEDFLRLYGVQPRKYSDPRIVGTLPREKLIESYKKSAGYFYFYKEENVCYLPPIEMMTIGGPVLYLPGSLLARYYYGESPGLCRDETEAKNKFQLLLKADKPFINEVIASQKPIREKYDPDHVYPIFDKTFRELLAPETVSKATPAIFDVTNIPTKTVPRIYVFFHFPGSLINFRAGRYSSSQGIPRVFKKVVESLLKKTESDIIITCFSYQVSMVHGYFALNDHGGRVQVLVINPADFPKPSKGGWEGKIRGRLKRHVQTPINELKEAIREAKAQARRYAVKQIKTIKARLLDPKRHPIKKLGEVFMLAPFAILGSPFALIMALGWKITRFVYRTWHHTIYKTKLYKNLQRVIRQINADPLARFVFVPHYYLFPEAFFLKAKTILYLPDFTPHFFTIRFDGRRDLIHTVVGRYLAKKADIIFSNSEFTKSYLPQTKLRVDPKKIRVFPLPLLMERAEDESKSAPPKAKDRLAGNSFIFYPTQNRPNKNIDFLLQVFANIRGRFPGLKLVLTCELSDYPPAEVAFERCGLENDVLFFHRVTDADLAWFYKHSSAVCLTTTMEGNFPPQAFEAMHFDVPFVSTRLPMFKETLGSFADSLLLCEPLNFEDFNTKLNFALTDRGNVLQKQRAAYNFLLNTNTEELFSAALCSMVGSVL